MEEIVEQKPSLERELERIFETANRNFLHKNGMLFHAQVSERTLCGALMIELYEVLKDTRFTKYFVDVEYNRNIGSKVKIKKKTIRGLREEIVTINCDLIVHSRGQNISCDNLIAVEMKKSVAREADKNSDRVRLECLTKKPGQDIWNYDGKALPEHVCGYGLGVYYEVNFKRETIKIEYYAGGCQYKEYTMAIEGDY